jgi:hypothetical protein
MIFTVTSLRTLVVTVFSWAILGGARWARSAYVDGLSSIAGEVDSQFSIAESLLGISLWAEVAEELWVVLSSCMAFIK